MTLSMKKLLCGLLSTVLINFAVGKSHDSAKNDFIMSGWIMKNYKWNRDEKDSGTLPIEIFILRKFSEMIHIQDKKKSTDSLGRMKEKSSRLKISWIIWTWNSKNFWEKWNKYLEVLLNFRFTVAVVLSFTLLLKFDVKPVFELVEKFLDIN